jgi:hypothetical protein
MPAPESRRRYQKAVLWPYAGVDRYGMVVRGEAREILVRWETGRKAPEGPDGKTLDLRFQVHVGEEIPLDSLMRLGSLEDWYGTNGTGGEDAGAEDEVCRVVSYREVPDVKGRHFRRTVSLERFQGAPPRRPTAGDSTAADLVITGAGFASRACDDCEDLNASFLVALTRNELDDQEWRTDYLELDTGTGTGSFDTEWQIVIERDKRAGTVVARYVRTGKGPVVTYQKAGSAAWDGASPLTLARVGAGDESCVWPATVTIRSADYVAPVGDVIVEGAGYSAGTCEGCLGLNADFTLAAVTAGAAWRSATPFSFDGAAHVWAAWRSATQSGVELRRAGDNGLAAAWVYAGAWDGLARVTFTFGGAAEASCCVWPAVLAVRGD